MIPFRICLLRQNRSAEVERGVQQRARAAADAEARRAGRVEAGRLHLVATEVHDLRARFDQLEFMNYDQLSRIIHIIEINS